MPFIFFRYFIWFSIYEGKSEMVSLYGGHLNFPDEQGIVLKIKEMCHIEHKTPEQMPFKFLWYLI